MPGLGEAFAGLAEALRLQAGTGGAPDDVARRERVQAAAKRAYEIGSGSTGRQRRDGADERPARRDAEVSSTTRSTSIPRTPKPTG